MNNKLIEYFAEFIAYIFLSIFLFIVGLGLSIYFSDYSILGRFGALITLVAILMAYQDFSIGIKKLDLDKAIDFLGKDKLLQFWADNFTKKYSHKLEGIKNDFNSNDALELLEKISSERSCSTNEYIKDWLGDLFNNISRRLRKVEFIMLEIGTLLWAFADLLNHL